ncbi:hypothetical protein [Cognatiluteimonas profundi]|uniref:hypothetical protein n=1 Tax=Cognatiluteimonas profundi TaxID=2594501 RepID=UPI00131B4A8B|nr:hypothetical protein [Lysobacter profundi]
MKRILFASLLCGLAFAAAAQQPPFAQAPEPHELKAADAKNQATNPFCLQETGSLITKAHNQRVKSDADKRCAPVPGRVWSRRDIERTGLDMADALRQLDPSIH